ncbi:ubiquitin fusion degradation protein [Phlyctema vagabunda]|uniref:Ubiquitin fusion degradation protein n=1 Tax=Phlyctema vagabunda TaxID=108571 RepID=A0ABR4PMP5_9HELO
MRSSPSNSPSSAFHMTSTPDITLAWSSTYDVAPKNSKSLPGDKILLPQSALEQLLAASTVTTTSTSRPNLAFDPFNPYSLAAARAEQSQWRDTQQQLPHPLTFRLVNAKNGNVVHAGIREFSADEGEVGLSTFLMEALGVKEPTRKTKAASVTNGGTQASDTPIDLTEPEDVIDLTEDQDEPDRITVHAKQLPKGTYVRLRPLEAGYNPDDWKSLLERHLRENYTTLTNGEMLTVRGPKSEEFRFLIDKFLPEGDGICVVDTDLEVDIEALNEEQARETLKQIMAKAQRAPGTAEGSSVGGELSIWKQSTGQVADGDYVDYQLASWDRTQGLEITLVVDSADDVDLFISPYSTHQRAKPREDEHIFGELNGQQTKKIRIQPSNIELEQAESLLVSIHASDSLGLKGARKYALSVKLVQKGQLDGSLIKPLVLEEDTDIHGPDEEQCKNCHQWVPKRSMMLHENFCLRNNVLCPHCENVFKKNSQEWKDHWHCPHDSGYGDTPESKSKHDDILHNSRPCPNCPYEAANLKDLAAHRTSICPGKIILCQFCHLEVPQEGDPFDPSPESLISGLSAHELADGARTTDCHLCSKIVRLRDMATHLKHHELEKSTKSRPAICRNVNCGRTLNGVGKNGEIGAGNRMGQGPGNGLGICSICFGPLYVSMHDPEGKAMKRRIERRYLQQLIKGCGRPSCTNLYCKTAKLKTERGNIVLSAKDALPLLQPLMATVEDHAEPMYFCVDDTSQKRRNLAEMLAGERVYDLEWCVAAFEAEGGNLDSARQWLHNWAPKRV